MDIRITPPVIGGCITAPPSKSGAIRALLCSALSDKPTYIYCDRSSEDIDACISCVRSLGAAVSAESGGMLITPADTFPARAIFDCGESATLLRFLIPVAAALGINADFIRRGSLVSRPVAPMLKELVCHGIDISEIDGILHSRGKLTPGDYTIDLSLSSQFFSGLLIALSLIKGQSSLYGTGNAVSAPYIGMTLSALHTFGADISAMPSVISAPAPSHIPTRCDINGHERLKSPGTYHVRGDWSAAAFWLVLGAISGTCVSVGGLADDGQGDMAVCNILRRAGINAVFSGGYATADGGTLRSFDINASDMPDLVPPLAALACFAQGISYIRGAAALRNKESNRLRSCVMALSSLGGNITENGDNLIINGKSSLSGGVADSFGDHRIAMAASVAAAGCGGVVTIKNGGVTAKSYPGFYRDLSALGMKVTEV